MALESLRRTKPKPISVTAMAAPPPHSSAPLMPLLNVVATTGSIRTAVCMSEDEMNEAAEIPFVLPDIATADPTRLVVLTGVGCNGNGGNTNNKNADDDFDPDDEKPRSRRGSEKEWHKIRCNKKRSMMNEHFNNNTDAE
jgi:hypothetical protein